MAMTVSMKRVLLRDSVLMFAVITSETFFFFFFILRSVLLSVDLTMVHRSRSMRYVGRHGTCFSNNWCVKLTNNGLRDGDSTRPFF